MDTRLEKDNIKGNPFDWLINFSVQRWMSVIYFLMLPFVAFIQLELFTHNAWQINWMMQVTNYIYFMAVSCLLFAIFSNQKMAGTVLLSVSYFVGLVNYLVLSFRGTPIMPLDYKSVGTAVSVLDNYSFPWSLRLFFTTVLYVMLLLANSKLSTLRIRNGVLRVVGIAAGMAMTIGVYQLINYPVYADMVKVDHTVTDASLMYQKNGFSVSFIRGVMYLQVPEPEGYSLDAVTDIMTEYIDSLPDSVREHTPVLYTEGAVYLSVMLNAYPFDAYAALNQAPQRPSKVIDPAPATPSDPVKNYKQPSFVRDQEGRPNVIVVMSEAFSELQVLADYKVNQDYLPFMHGLKENTIKGYFHSSIIGGNTATSEFEFLTSDTMAFLPNGSVAYQQFVIDSMPTLNTVLEDQGYYSVAMHPYKPEGWERNVVYPYFDFDKIKFEEDFVNQDLIREYISDEALFDEILMELEAAPADQPAFIFTVSMQNHGGYTKLYENFEPDVWLDEEGNFDAINQYLSLLKETDRAFGSFIETLEQQDEETIVLFYGDHQPNNSTVSELEKLDDYSEDASDRYIVPYLIWANFEIEEGDGQTSSLNFLAGDLLDAAGIEASPYMNFLNDLQQVIPVITQDYFITADGKQYFFNEIDRDDLDEELRDMLNKYQILQYNHLIDFENRIDTIFRVDSN